MTAVRVRSDDVTWQLIDDDLVVLDLASSTYLRVVGAGAQLWPLVVEGRDDTELVTCLVETFGIEQAVAATDVREFLDALVSHDLVVLEPADRGAG